VKGLRLCRNFGHQYALLSGLAHADGFAVITMDADLQHPPATIPELLKQWNSGNKIVHTTRRDHQNIPWFKKLTSRIFYRIFSLLSGIEISEGASDFRLLDKQVVQDLLQFKESGLFLRGLVQWVGYPNTSVEYQCRERYSGETKYTLLKMLKFAWSGIASFSIIPLRLATFIGIMTSLVAFYELGDALYAKLVLHEAVRGWTSLFGFMSLFFGVLFILLGVLGEYIARILEEVRGRPRYIVSEVIGVGLVSATDVGEAASAILPVVT
jgi:dolichol-phosphate mannosyltransferase